MRKNNRKGFTIVELVIVIAVIAILAGVLIPTFSSVVEKANKSADIQKVRNLYTEYVSKVDANTADKVYVQAADDVYYLFENGELDDSQTFKAADFADEVGADVVSKSATDTDVVVEEITEAATTEAATTEADPGAGN